MPASRSSYTTTGPLDARADYRLTAKTQITPPCGTSVLEPRMSSSAPCMRCASTPQPDCTATYCLPSTAKELGTPVTPELVVKSHSTAPVIASKARNFRSFVPPEKTRPPPVVSTGPQFCHLNACVHTFWPVFMFQACTSPMLVAPGRRLRVDVGRSMPRYVLPGGYGSVVPSSVLQWLSLAGM